MPNKSTQGKPKKNRKESGYKTEGMTIQDLIREVRSLTPVDTWNKEYVEDLINAISGFGSEELGRITRILKNENDRARRYCPAILARMDPVKASDILIPLIDDPNISSEVIDALAEIGQPVAARLIAMFNDRLTSSGKTGNVDKTDDILLAIGKTRCDESSNLLNNLLAEYIEKMPRRSFDTNTHEWKFKNVDFFYILEAIVRQQDERLIPVLKKARDAFHPEYTEHLLCQIAIGRIIKKRPEEGFLPLEVMDIMLPTAKIMGLLTGESKEFDSEQAFKKEYGEYFEPDFYDGKRKVGKRAKK
ncbi:MAG: HEAT repeat domain-containing protein [Thermoplasmata archaeon]